ncbi:MAG: alpha/beta hydrolase [Roseiflexus sp.]|nr:alpha/beta hydrolase [Roseiflexus sp.]MCS7289247.1 alpha/beta hydrolase [Roseiflexus sp.]MDW8146691.1 alpha/beta hydrolase [Roseiflexaceae bacterium]MDW8234469.1 alpha/beta hydrolase [Roseiflexaceae bacterium]
MFHDFQTIRIKTQGAEIHLVRGGSGPPLLLLHGYPQTHLMWRKVALRLAAEFTVVAADLRGYGDSSKPPGGADHAAYSKRAMAQDMVEVMNALGFSRFMVAGHDRGARVVHRLCRDYPDAVIRAAVLDIAPTLYMYTTADRTFAEAYYHWFFLIQPYDLPERLISADPEYYLRKKLAHWGRTPSAFEPEVIAEYVRCFSDPATIHATCEDYRAAASIDLRHDEADLHVPVACPLLVLWGAEGFVGRRYDLLAVWRQHAVDVRGHAIPGGHFLPEEAPEETYAALRAFFAEA